MNELQIRLTADIQSLQSALAKAKKTISEFEKETTQETEKGNVGFRRKIGLIEALTQKSKQLREALSKATNEKDIERYNQELEQTIKEMSRLNALGRQVTNTLGGANNGFNQATRSIGSANGVALEFNRIIQDAPFGIIGIGNNLQQLAGNFSAASKDAGGAGKAIAASLSALVSPANLVVLGISAITAAFTAYQLGAFDFLKSTEDSIKTLEDYRESLDAVTRASLEGAAQGEKEAQSFRLLRAQAENLNIPLKTRIEAVKELQRTFPSYLGNLTQEQILAGDVGDAYKELTQEIIATAKARAFSDQIAENQLKRFTLEEQAANRVNDILKARDEFTEAEASIYDVGEIEIIKQINDLSQQQIDDINEINKLKAEEEKLTNKINEQISQGAKFTKDTKKETEEVKRAFEKLPEAVNDALERINLDRLDQFRQGIDVPLSLSSGKAETEEIIDTDKVERQIESLDALKKALQGTGITIEQFYAAIANGAAEGFDSLSEFISKLSETQEFIDKASAILEAGIENTIGDIAFAIGDALASGGNILQAGGAALLGGLATVLNQLGQLAIETGITIGAIKVALESLNPAIAIAAGVALVALAGFVSNKARSLGNSNGGSVGSPSFSGSGGGGSIGAPPQIFTNNPQSFSPNYTGFNGGSPLGQLELTARASYDSIIFGLGQYQEARNRS